MTDFPLAYVLTPKSPHPLTGLSNPLLGWHFIGSEADTVLAGCRIIHQYSPWTFAVVPHPTDRSLQAANFSPEDQTNPNLIPLTVNDTDWFAWDGHFVCKLTEQEVNDGYNVTVWTGPPQ